jgi:hypothetical protein
MNQHHDAFYAVFSTMLDTASCFKALFTSEHAVYHITHVRSVVFWDRAILHFTVVLERDTPHVMVWAGMQQLVWLPI